MLKKVIIFILLIFLCSSCNNVKDNNKNQEQENKKEELIVYDYKEPLTHGVFNINKDFGINGIEVFFISNDYHFHSKFDENPSKIKIDSINGENSEVLTIDYTKCNGFGSYEKYQLNYLFISINTNSKEEIDARIDNIDITIDGVSFKIYTDLLFHIRPDMEFIQDYNGTLLLKPFDTAYFKDGIYFRNYNPYISGTKYYFEQHFLFNNINNILLEEKDYLVINKVILEVNGPISNTKNYFYIDDINSSRYQPHEFSKDIIGLKANYHEYFHDLFSIQIYSTINSEQAGIYYFSLSIEYYFSFDETIRTISLGSYCYNDVDNILNEIFK